MKLQYLGTAAAECWPAIFCECPACLEAARRGGRNIRHRSGAIVNDRVLIDLSADLYAMKLRLGLNLSRVRHVLITHAQDIADCAKKTHRILDGELIRGDEDKHRYDMTKGGAADEKGKDNVSQ